ncbi:DUF4446 family protein [Candidatus Roizmanbacteria bacterium]|nr:DUF4446 family protein [Candidatus Roizmanbacteria bacterium]
MYGYTLGAIVFLWLLFLSFLVYKARSHYYTLSQRTKRQSIDDILDAILERSAKLEKEIEHTKKMIDQIQEDSQCHFRKLGIVRFNPFGRTSSDQSFVIALLDKTDRGVTINFIYTHEGIRVYAKTIKDGKGEKYVLSEEEQKAIKHAHTIL